ncbi:MAG: DUF2914 domain-containing protein [bacterium]|nr:DUF2914 domain-containing protein [bacterium]
MVRKYLPRSTEELIRWYERYISPLALIAGFLADNYILLRRVDLWTSNLLFFSYLIVVAVGIVLINLIATGRLKNPFFLKAAPFLPVIAQFAFGGLFSGYVSLYSRSAAYSTSWIFVGVLALLLLGNERFTRFYARFTFQVGILFTVLFSFLIFYLPVILGSIGPYIFVASGIVSLGLMAVFVRFLGFLMPEHVRTHRTEIARSIAIIFVTFNILYFSNAIPPLPLALKEAGVYHGVVKQGDEYLLSAEPVPWYESYLRYNTVYHKTAGETVFIYSAVFAPSEFSTTILHEWEFYNEKTGAWVKTATFGFPLTGGRDGGYRGFSMRENLDAGTWRVNVKTGNGLIIGRIAFTVEDVSSPARTIEIRN